MKRLTPLFLIVFLFTLSGSASAYDIRINANIPLAEKISGISINPEAGTALAAGSETKSLNLIDTLTNAVIKKIPLNMTHSELAEPTGVAVYAKKNQAVVSSNDGALYFIDLGTGDPVKTIYTGRTIHSIAINKANDMLYMGNSNSLMAMDLKKEKTVKETSVPSTVVSMDIDYNSGYLLVLTEGTGELSIYNSETLQPVTEIKICSSTPNSEPGTRNCNLAGVSVNQSTHIAVLTNKSDNSISIISLENRAILDTISFNPTLAKGGEGGFSVQQPGSIAIEPVTNTALISHKNGIAIIKLENPVPLIHTLIPEFSRAGDTGFTLSIKGEKFVKETKARFNLKELDTKVQDNFSLQADVPLSELQAPRNVDVSVVNPSPGGGPSNKLSFKIYNPIPAIDSVTPATVALTSLPSAIRVYGKGFLPVSGVNLNGQNLKTRFISSILLEAEMKPADIESPGKYMVVVLNPSPGTFTSNAAYLNVVEEGDPSLMNPASGVLTPQLSTLSTSKLDGTGTLKGRIINTNKEPVEGATMQIGKLQAETDAQGYFLLENVPAGKRVLIMHGSTAKEQNGHYPTIPITVDIKAGIINEMPFQPYLHRQKDRNFKDIDHEKAAGIRGPERPDIDINGDLTITDPEVPGVELKIPKGVKIIGWDGKPNKKVSIRTVPSDRLPIKPLPDNAFARTVYMFYFDKVGGGTPDQPIPFKAPNDLGLLPGEKAVLWYYDESPNEGEAPNDWAIAGTGTVTPDGKYIVSDPGVGLPKFCCGAAVYGGEGSNYESSGHNDNDNDDDKDYKDSCDGEPSGSAGDPVDVATGYFTYKHTDYRLNSVIPVNITRHYRSGDNGLGGYGAGTYFAYDWWIGEYEDMLLLLMPGNYQYRFYKQADGSYINTSDPRYRGAVIYKISTGVFRLKMKNGWQYSFNYYSPSDANNSLLSEIRDQNGNALTLLKELGNITEITTPDGRIITFILQMGGTGRDTYTKISGPNGTVTYSYTVFGKLTSATYPDGISLSYVYDASGRMTKITQNGKVVIINKYDANNRVIRQTRADGGVYSFSYTLTAGFVTQTTMTAPNGAVTTWRFNSDKYITERTTQDGTTTYTREAGTNRILIITDPLGRHKTYTYDTKGRRTAITDNSGNTTTYAYEDVFDKVVSITDALGHVTTMTYDGNGNLASRTAPDNGITTFTYNGYGKPLTVTDPLGRVTHMEYDTHANLTKVTDSSGNFTTMAYDDTGRKTSTTDAMGNTTTYQYGPFNKISRVTDALGNITNYAYDTSGNLSSVTDANGHSISYNYDEMNRASSMTDQLGLTETYTYDTSDNRTSVTDRKGKTTAYAYDVMNRITEVQDPLLNITGYSYSPDGKLAMVTDAKNHDIMYEYDSGGHLTKMTDQLGNIETYTYDSIGNLLTMTDRKGQTTTHTYDMMNRLTRTDYADGSYVTYTYDAGGRMLTVTDSVTGAISYTYGNGDKATGETTPLGSISYTEDATGRRTSMTVSGLVGPTQPTVNYTYDNVGRLNDINTLIGGEVKHFTATYDALGLRSNITLPNGVTTHYSYDNGNHLLTLKHLNALNSELETLNYSYDANGNRISMSRPYVPLTVRDSVSNTSYNEANQMLTFNDKNISYDNNGNMTSVTNSCGTTNYTWDVRNRLVGINGFKTDCSSLTASFTYDVLGRRIETTINGTNTKYLYDGVDVIQELNQDGTVKANYIRALNIDEPLTRIKADGTVRHYLRDALGSVIALTDDSGVVTTTYSYDPFGNTTASGEASDNTFQYTGRENDGTGLYYYRERYYSPELQRFISEDPIELEGGINKFAYVGNNPANNIDPEGTSYLEYSSTGHTLCLFSCDNKVGCWSAYNIICGNKATKWEQGHAYDFAWVSYNKPVASVGSHGNWIFDVPGCEGCGVHAGRWGPQACTNGCIRTTNIATRSIEETHNNDPMEYIRIK